MAKSRMALRLAIPLVALLSAAPALAAQAGPDRLVERQREQLREGLRLDCPVSGPEEIVVCGSREERSQDRHRLILPPETPQGAAHRAGGEQRDALAIDTSRCTSVGRDQVCTSGLNMIGIGIAVARAIANAIEQQD